MAEIQQNPFYQQQYPNFGTYNVPSKGLEEIKRQDNIAGKVADRVDPETGLKDMIIEGAKFGIPMSMVFTHGTNWLMKPKNITDTMSQIQAYENSRLYQLGTKLDNLAPVRWSADKANKAGKLLGKIPVPQAFKDLWKKIKIGTVSTWDGTGMYTLGKQSEAMKETMEFFSQVGDDAIKKLGLSTRKEKLLIDVLTKFRTGKINHVKGYKILDWAVKDIPASKLKEISEKTGIFSRIFGTNKDLSLSLSKARFFAGKAATKPVGPFGKFFNKMTSLIGEASGGGVLGGKAALLMNAFGISSGFVAAKKAEKGDKFKAFMEDYMGFTIGSYLGMMFEGWAMHKLLGASEHGMQLSKCNNAIKSLNLKGTQRVQDVVIAYNREFKQTKAFNKLLNKINKGKVSNGGGFLNWIWGKLTGKVSVGKIQDTLKKAGITPTGNDLATLRTTLQNAVSGKNKAWFETLRREIKGAMKPKASFFSIFKKGNSGKNIAGRFLDWFTQGPVASVAKVCSTGKYTLLKDGFGSFGRTLKRVGGGIGRMVLISFVLIPPISNAMMKLSHKIFGKPKNSALDERTKGQQEPQNTPNAMPVNTQPQQTPSQNLVDLYTQNMPKKQTTTQPLPDSGDGHDKATYIPNQLLTQESYIDPSITQDLLVRRDLALKHADSAEKNALDLLGRL